MHGAAQRHDVELEVSVYGRVLPELAIFSFFFLGCAV